MNPLTPSLEGAYFYVLYIQAIYHIHVWVTVKTIKKQGTIDLCWQVRRTLLVLQFLLFSALRVITDLPKHSCILVLLITIACHHPCLTYICVHVDLDSNPFMLQLSIFYMVFNCETASLGIHVCDIHIHMKWI